MALTRRTDDLQDKSQASSLLPSDVELHDVDRTGGFEPSMVDSSFVLPPVQNLYEKCEKMFSLGYFGRRRLFVLLPAVTWIFTAQGVPQCSHSVYLRARATVIPIMSHGCQEPNIDSI